MAIGVLLQGWTTVVLLLLNVSVNIAKFGIGYPKVGNVDKRLYHMAGASLFLWCWIGIGWRLRRVWMDRVWWTPLKSSGRPLPRIVERARRWRTRHPFWKIDVDDEDEDIGGDKTDKKHKSNEDNHVDEDLDVEVQRVRKGDADGEKAVADPQQLSSEQHHDVEKYGHVDEDLEDVAKAQSFVMKLVLVVGHGVTIVLPLVFIFGMVMFFMSELTLGLIPEYKSDSANPNAAGFDCDALKSDVLAQCEVDVMRSVAAVVASMWLIIDMGITNLQYGKMDAGDERVGEGDEEGDLHDKSLRNAPLQAPHHVYADDPGQKIEITSMSDVDLSPRRLWELRQEKEKMWAMQEPEAKTSPT
ncbi:hypothetical protein DFQ27_001041 [Actinomortierella ambigua]|uniref:Uncharacterized protein n=1 Tax=Actinomortierella ambigua TaxID=1343610 RepID=A0A9P6QBA1_9FUNG|nr:hypothetical protein DFQ27_001041 [Actinomortierella ambigua]